MDVSNKTESLFKQDYIRKVKNVITLQTSKVFTGKGTLFICTGILT